MAIGKASDFKIYHDEFYGGMFEALEQFIGAFNEASRGAIRLVQAEHRGDYQKESFLKQISSLVTRRDTTSVASATDLAMTQDEIVRVKLNRKIGPVAQTLDAWRKIGKDQQEMSLKLGRMIGEEVLKDMLNAAIRAGDAALTANEFDATAGTITVAGLINGLAKMGDKAGDVVAWVTHSKPLFDLMKDQAANHAFAAGNIVVVQGGVASLNRPLIVTDAPPLFDAVPAPDQYHILGLTEGAIEVIQSEERELVDDIVTGLENLVFRVQGEHAFSVGVKGFKWDVTNGGANPNDTALGTNTNWDQVATSLKNGAGFRIRCQ